MARTGGVILRLLASGVVVGASLLTIYRWTYLPVLSTNTLFRLQASMDRTLRTRDLFVTAVRARRDLSVARSTLQRYPPEIGLYAVAATNADLLGRKSEAIELCERSLRWGIDPAVLRHLGTLYCETGRREQAVGTLSGLCSTFPYYCADVSHECYAAEAR